MPRIEAIDAQGWGEPTKLDLSTLDLYLLNQIETEVLGRLSGAFTTTTWTNSSNTPALVKVIIAKMYVSWFYDRQYSENQDEGNDYAAMLRANAEMLITGLLDGTIELPEAEAPSNAGKPAFYPNDASSAMEPTPEDRSLGPAKFSMGKVF
jgi:hypothetical protein